MQAFSWYQKAAKQGDPDALYNEGLCYLYGDGTLANTWSAQIAFTLASNQDDAYSQYQLGLMYLKGTPELKQNNEDAYFYFLLADEHGCPDAKAQITALNSKLSVASQNAAKQRVKTRDDEADEDMGW